MRKNEFADRIGPRGHKKTHFGAKWAAARLESRSGDTTSWDEARHRDMNRPQRGPAGAPAGGELKVGGFHGCGMTARRQAGYTRCFIEVMPAAENFSTPPTVAAATTRAVVWARLYWTARARYLAPPFKYWSQ